MAGADGAALRIVVDTNLLLRGRVRRDISAWARRELVQPVWSATLVAEFARVMTEHEMDLRATGRAWRDHATWQADFRSMLDAMEEDYEMVSATAAGAPPPHVIRNPKDAHLWWTAINGDADCIVTGDVGCTPRPDELAEVADIGMRGARTARTAHLTRRRVSACTGPG